MMKTKISILFVIALLLTACNSKEKLSIEDTRFDNYFFNKGNIPTVKGKVLNLLPDEIESMKIEYTIVTPFEQDRFQIKKSGMIESDGSFELEIDYAFPNQQIWLTVGDLLYAGIYANSDLYIELDADSLRDQKAYMNGPGVTYSGSDGELTTLMNNRILYKPEVWRKLSKEIDELRYNSQIGHDEFLTKYDSLYTLLFQSDDEFLQENPSEFAWLIKNERKSDYYAQLCTKHWNPANKMDKKLFDEIINHKSYLISNSGSSFYSYLYSYLNIQSMQSHKDYFMEFKDYSLLTKEEKNMLNELAKISEQIEENQPYDTLKYQKLGKAVRIAMKDTIATYRTIQLINQFDSLFDAPKADLLKLKISSKDPKELKLIMDAILPSVQTNWCYEIIQERSEESLHKLSSINSILNNSKPFVSDIYLGQPIAEMEFGAKLYKVDTLSPMLLLQNIKSANKDKGIIIDFWATWCSPCMHGLPHAKKLYDETDGQAREFIYLCPSSSNFDLWKTKIAENELGGTHIFVEKKINSELMDLFSVNGFPSNVFIDREGNYRPGAIKRLDNMKKSDLIELL